MVKGYHQSLGDHTIFQTFSSWWGNYLDDIIITGKNLEEIGELKPYLAKEFKIKDLDSLRYFLWIEVARSKK